MPPTVGGDWDLINYSWYQLSIVTIIVRLELLSTHIDKSKNAFTLYLAILPATETLHLEKSWPEKGELVSKAAILSVLLWMASSYILIYVGLPFAVASTFQWLAPSFAS